MACVCVFLFWKMGNPFEMIEMMVTVGRIKATTLLDYYTVSWFIHPPPDRTSFPTVPHDEIVMRPVVSIAMWTNDAAVCYWL